MFEGVFHIHYIPVDSNDALYGADPKFIAEINKMCNIIVDEVLADLKHLGQTDQLRKQSQLAMELFIRIVTRSDITNPAMVHLATNLWQLSQRSGQYDKKLAVRSFNYCNKFCSIKLSEICSRTVLWNI